ncbi:alpha amylase, catalytic domain protein [Mycobacterium kansasii]|uniref:Alpha amylase, catalytic domain protein n=1 Tax=Mycobacterium kansasii TaxID=1768 RepID=A0A1V3W9F1_MYCKA|nr:alpha amylase, catalytic domain protein [Mycobacterium kansasii]
MDYLQWLGIDCIWLPRSMTHRYVTAVRHPRLLQGAARLRYRRRFVALVDRPPPRNPGHHRPGDEPHFGIPPVVPGIRRDPDGPYGDYYVWSDTSQKYTDARIIFVDTEESNWTFDPVRRQFYWHRFFSHQPDLNYDNPAVQEAMIDVMRFWLAWASTVPADAVPYLFERERHQLRKPARDARLPQARPQGGGRRISRPVLLAEATSGGRRRRVLRRRHHRGDECHMAFTSR